MADTGKQSPLGINVLGTLLQNQGFWINPTAASYYGENKTTAGPYTPGLIVEGTCLRMLCLSTLDAFSRGYNGGAWDVTVTSATYDQMINIGQSRITALGNSKPPTFITQDPGGVWNGEANSGYGVAGPEDPGYDVGEGQGANWTNWDTSNPNVEITKYGFLRCLPLMAWYEYNWNGATTDQAVPEYKDWLQSFMSADGFINYSNKALFAIQNSKTFLDGTYSNMNDLISADIAGVSLSSRAFGEDLLNLGYALDLSRIAGFGLPSNLLQTIAQRTAFTANLSLALLAAGLSQEEIEYISPGGDISVTKEQEQQIYSAFLVITGASLAEILQILGCRTPDLLSLADLLNVKKIFPISYSTLTVPIYNTDPGPTNSKTYYLLFVDDELNPMLITPQIEEEVGTIIVDRIPPIIEEEILPTEIIEQAIENAPINVTTQEIINAYEPVQENTQTTPDIVTINFPDWWQALANIGPINIGSFGGIGLPGTGGTVNTPQGGGGCVTLETFLPLADGTIYNGNPIRQAWQLDQDMSIMLCDEKSFTNSHGKIKKALVDVQPCVRILTSDGVSLICSTTAPIYTEEGFIFSPNLLGKKVAVMKDNKIYYSKVVLLQDAGDRYVRVIDTGNNSFWAGEQDGAYLLHHNATIDNQDGFINVGKS